MIVTLVLSIILMGATFLIIFSITAFIQSKQFFSSAPQDIQEAIIERDKERFPGARIIGWVIFIFGIVAFGGAFVYGAWDGFLNEFSFVLYFARFLTMLYLFKIFDIIFLDWFLLTKVRYYQHYFPETEGCTGYQSFGFNRKSQTIRFIVYLFVALLLAGICCLF